MTSAQNNGVTEAALSDARDMLDKSVDLFVTSNGISGLVSKRALSRRPSMAEPISFGTASKIFAGFNYSVIKQGFDGMTDFGIQRERPTPP